MLKYAVQVIGLARQRTALGLALLGLALAAGSPVNQSMAQGYYDGETITLIMGLDASAGGTTVGRLLAKHLEMNLEGNPNVVVRNMPGASMMSAHIFVLLKAPRDGTTLYYGPRSSLGELLEFPGIPSSIPSSPCWAACSWPRWSPTFARTCCPGASRRPPTCSAPKA